MIYFRDVISLLARVFIFLIDGATQEVPIKKCLKVIVGQVFEIYAIELLGSLTTGMTSLTLHYICIRSTCTLTYRDFVCKSL